MRTKGGAPAECVTIKKFQTDPHPSLGQATERKADPSPPSAEERGWVRDDRVKNPHARAACGAPRSKGRKKQIPHRHSRKGRGTEFGMTRQKRKGEKQNGQKQIPHRHSRKGRGTEFGMTRQKRKGESKKAKSRSLTPIRKERGWVRDDRVEERQAPEQTQIPRRLPQKARLGSLRLRSGRAE